MSSYTREELIGSPFSQYFTDPKRAAAGVRLTLDKGAATNYELTLRTKDGRESLISFNAAIFKDPSGKVRGIFASARDITEPARLQAQLAQERAYNRGLIEASVDGLVTVDEAMTITDVNDTMCRMAGRPRNQLIGSSFPTYFSERTRAEEGVRLTFSKGAVTNYVLTLQAASGSQVPVSFNGLEALAAIEQRPVDAVISDILMPRMDGFRLCHELKKNERLAHLPFIIYSATYTSPDDERLALDSGANRYLRKPALPRPYLRPFRRRQPTRKQPPKGASPHQKNWR
jgi:PAS domain S-box-containing protein